MLNCRSSHAEFIIPYQKYIKSMAKFIQIGTRFRMRLDADDAPERRCKLTNSFSPYFIRHYNMIVFSHLCRYSGVVTGIGDLDPYRWPNSKWRCLMVGTQFIALVTTISS